MAALARPVEPWSSVGEHTHDDLRAVGGVFIGGGNTYHLLNEVRRSGFDDVLRDRRKTGVVYGGSAGAILFGSDIGTAGHFDPNDVGPTNTTGLGLLGSLAVWCHYEEGHTDNVRAWARATGRPVLVLSERSGAEATDHVLSAIGHESVLIPQPPRDDPGSPSRLKPKSQRDRLTARKRPAVSTRAPPPRCRCGRGHRGVPEPLALPGIPEVTATDQEC